MHDVEWIGGEHSPERPFPRGGLRAGTDRLFDLRASEALEQVWHQPLLVDSRAGRVVQIGNDAPRARLVYCATYLAGNEIDRFVPRRLTERSLTLGPHTDQRPQDPLGRIDAFCMMLDLLADPAVGQRIRRLIGGRCIDVDDATRFDGDFQRTGVGAVERAGGPEFHCGFSGASRSLNRSIRRSDGNPIHQMPTMATVARPPPTTVTGVPNA